MNLFELTRNWLQIIEMSDQLDEETLQDTLESIEEPIQDKLENVYKVIRTIESDIEMIDKEQKRMAELKVSKNKTIERLKNMAFETVKLVGEDTKTGGKQVKFNSPFIKTMTVQNNPPSVNVLDPDLVPEQYLVPQPDKVDTQAIKGELSAMKKAWQEQQKELKKQWKDEGFKPKEVQEKLDEWLQDNPEPTLKMAGIEIMQTQGVRFR